MNNFGLLDPRLLPGAGGNVSPMNPQGAGARYGLGIPASFGNQQRPAQMPPGMNPPGVTYPQPYMPGPQTYSPGVGVPVGAPPMQPGIGMMRPTLPGLNIPGITRPPGMTPRPGMMPTNMGQYAPPMPRVNGVAANLPPPQNYFPAPIIRSDGLNYFPAPIIRSDVPMGTLRPGAPTRPQLPGDRTMYTVNRPFAVP